MAPVVEKIMRFSEVKANPFKSGECFKVLDLKISGSFEGGLEKVLPPILMGDPTEIKILEDSKVVQMPSNVFRINSDFFFAKGREIFGAAPKPALALLVLAGLGAFFLDMKALSWIGSLFGFLGFPILGMVRGGGKKDDPPWPPEDFFVSERRNNPELFYLSPNGIPIFSNLEEYIETPAAEWQTMAYEGRDPSMLWIYEHMIEAVGEKTIAGVRRRIKIQTLGMEEAGGDVLYDLIVEEDLPRLDVILNEYAFGLMTRERDLIEKVHLALVKKIRESATVQEAIDWLLYESPWGPSLFERLGDE